MKQTPNLYTDPTLIQFHGLHQDPSDTGCYFDFYLAQTDCDRAILSFNTKDRHWYATLCETDTVEEDFEDDYAADWRQVAALVLTLPHDERIRAEAWTPKRRKAA